ncbi:MAG: tetratricopeptide repeat protein [Pseudomonadota bacterium]
MRSNIAVLAGLAVLLAPLAALAQDVPSLDEASVRDCVQGDQVILRIEACTRVIQDGVDSEENIAWAFINRALAYERVRRFDRALEDYNNALLLDPTYAVGYNNRGNLHASQGNLDLAIADHTRATEINPEYAEAWFNLGADYVEAEDDIEAIAAFDRAVALDPEYRLAIADRAAAHCRVGNVEEAIEDRLQLLAIGQFTAEDLQQFLQDGGYYRGAIDGLFGRGSRGALRAWTEAGCPPG